MESELACNRTQERKWMLNKQRAASRRTVETIVLMR